MKRISIYALMGAIALTGALGLSGCSSSDEVEAPVNPGFDPVTNEVPVDFVMSISTNNSATTRMTAGNTQAVINDDNKFRGIGVSHLRAYKATADNMHVFSGDAKAEKEFELGTIVAAGALDPRENTTTSSRRVLELSVPINTNCIMFWGKAIKTGTDAQQGNVTMSIAEDKLSNSTISLASRLTNDNVAALTQYQELIARVLTKIVQSEIPKSSLPKQFPTEGTAIETIEDSQLPGKLAWRDYVDVTGGTIVEKTKDPILTSQSLGELGVILAKSFRMMNTINTNELRAGSSSAVLRMIADLYNTINHIDNATPTNLGETYAKLMGSQIKENMKKCFTDFASTCHWVNTLSEITTYANAGLTEALSTDKVTSDGLNDFPKNFGLPLGSALLAYDVATNTYSYRNGVGISLTTGSDQKYLYPAELCYFGNSPVRVTTDPHVQADYPDGSANWDNDDNWGVSTEKHATVAWTKGSHVTSSTRSVAMQENVNYGTALLKTTVRFGAATLKDNNAAIQYQLSHVTEADKDIDATATGQFELTGVLIGGQSKEVGWNYLAKSTEATDRDFIVYDSQIASAAIPAYSTTAEEQARSIANYTMVWDNYMAADGAQPKVRIALEFQNKAGDFYGENNMIRNGGTFYIVGELDPTKEGAQATLKWPLERDATDDGTTTGSPYALPPYDATTGKTVKTARVFIQDYVTEANFVIGENSLKHALVALPDLRASQLSLGLSVDLSWSKGLTYDNVLLGGE